MKNPLAAYRYLVALHQHKHFGRAAEACHITQPALSNAIRALETDIGATLVLRGRAFNGFTPEGERVLQSAYRLLREHDVLEQDLYGLRDAPSGTVTLGVVPTALPVAARFVARLRTVHPGVRAIVRSMSSVEIEEGLDALAIDMGLGYAERTAPVGLKLERILLYTERYYLLRRTPERSGPLTVSAPVTWRDAARQPLCLLTPDMHNRAIVDAAFASAQCVVSPAIETDSIVTLAIAAASGAVASVLPGPLARLVETWDGVSASPLIEPDVATPVAWLVNTEARLSRAFDAALALARDTTSIEQAVATATLGTPSTA